MAGSRHRRPARRSSSAARVYALYALAGILALLTLLLIGGALASNGSIATTHGTITTVVLKYGHARGERLYDASELHLAGDGATYSFVRDDFTPRLPGALEDGGTVNQSAQVWYVESFPPPSHPVVVALQLAATPGQPATQYVTDGYTHPGDTRGALLIGAAVTLALAIGCGLLGRRLSPPARSEPARRPAPVRAPSRAAGPSPRPARGSRRTRGRR